MSIIIKGITIDQFNKDTNKMPYMDVGWDIEELPDDKVVCARLQVISEKVDGYEEEFHWEADNVLCELLETLGYKETVEYFKKHPKWYS